MTTGSMRKPICFTNSSIVITYLHVKLSTKYRYVRYKISDSSVRYSMFRHLHRIAHLSDVICAIQGCTPPGLCPLVPGLFHHSIKGSGRLSRDLIQSVVSVVSLVSQVCLVSQVIFSTMYTRHGFISITPSHFGASN